MKSYQYVGDSHTFTRLTKNGDKVKVGFGEIVESDLEPKTFLFNGFKEVAAKEVKAKVETPKASPKK